MRPSALLLKLALAAAAGLFTGEASWAGEPPVKAKPVQYVRICSGYGDGFSYVPGTDTCVKLGGYLRVQTEYNMGGGATPDGTLGQVAQARYNRADTNDVDFRVRASLTFDARSQTEFGVLRSYVELGIQQTTPANTTQRQLPIEERSTPPRTSPLAADAATRTTSPRPTRLPNSPAG